MFHYALFAVIVLAVLCYMDWQVRRVFSFYGLGRKKWYVICLRVVLFSGFAYTADEMDAVSSASLKIEDGIGYGHAELLALAAQEVTGGDIFPIKVDDLYPETYGGAFDRHHSEMGTSIRPELTEHLESIENYDTVIIIYPNWLSSMPVPVLSFLEEYDFSGKTIIPIATSQALGLGSGPEQIAAACPDAVVADGLSARSEDGVKEFLTKAGLAK